jgi:hypothetical protein
MLRIGRGRIHSIIFSKLRNKSKMATGNVDQDEEAMWRSLEDDDDAFNSQYREERVHKLTGAITNLQNMRDYKFGLLSEETEKEIISQTAKFKHCIVRFKSSGLYVL